MELEEKHRHENMEEVRRREEKERLSKEEEQRRKEEMELKEKELQMREKRLQVTNNRDRVAMHAKLCSKLPFFFQKRKVRRFERFIGVATVYLVNEPECFVDRQSP